MNGGIFMKNQTGTLSSTNGTHFIYVAPSNSTQKNLADYICDGTNDAQQINAAISAASAGTEIILLDGKFNIREKISVNKNDLTIRGMGCSTTLEQAELAGSTTALMFDITADRLKLKDMMLVDIDVNYPQYLISTYGDVYECEFKRLVFILKSTKTNLGAYINLNGTGLRFFNCRVFSNVDVPNKMTINVIGNSPIIFGILNTGVGNTKINFSNKTYSVIASNRTEIYVNNVKQ